MQRSTQSSPFPLEDSVDEPGRNTQSFAATIPAARKLKDSGSTPWAIECAITDAVKKAERILQKVDERWPTE